MSFLTRCLRIGYVLSFSLVILLLVWPGRSRGQFHRNMLPPPPVSVVPTINPFVPVNRTVIGIGSFPGGFTGFSSFGLGGFPIATGAFPVGFRGFPGFGIGTFNGFGFNGFGFGTFNGFGLNGFGLSGFPIGDFVGFNGLGFNGFSFNGFGLVGVGGITGLPPVGGISGVLPAFGGVGFAGKGLGGFNGHKGI